MEVHPGVFVSKTSTDEWEPDLEVGGQMHVLCSGVGVEAGLSRFVEGSDPTVRWTLPDRETILVLEGAAMIELAGGPTLDLKVGDIASMPKGAETTWHLTLPFKEFWVIG
jgi:ethanolamine utilization protein EutQ (cupin superfamily)